MANIIRHACICTGKRKARDSF